MSKIIKSKVLCQLNLGLFVYPTQWFVILKCILTQLCIWILLYNQYFNMPKGWAIVKSQRKVIKWSAINNKLHVTCIFPDAKAIQFIWIGRLLWENTGKGTIEKVIVRKYIRNKVAKCQIKQSKIVYLRGRVLQITICEYKWQVKRISQNILILNNFNSNLFFIVAKVAVFTTNICHNSLQSLWYFIITATLLPMEWPKNETQSLETLNKWAT